MRVTPRHSDLQMFQPSSQPTNEQMMRVLARQPKSQQTNQQMMRVMPRQSPTKLCRSVTCRWMLQLKRQQPNEQMLRVAEPHKALQVSLQPKTNVAGQSLMKLRRSATSIFPNNCANDVGDAQAEPHEAAQVTVPATNKRAHDAGDAGAEPHEALQVSDLQMLQPKSQQRNAQMMRVCRSVTPTNT